MDSGFRCKYLVLKNVFNQLVTDTVNFVAYDHYGRPRFEKSEYVVLYISKSTKENYFFHKKYQFDHLERDSEGQFYGYDYTIKERKRYTVYKDKRQVSPEELFIKRKEAVFKPFFN